ncbi:arylesterase [Rhodobacter sp.]
MKGFLQGGVTKAYGAIRAACNVTIALIFSAGVTVGAAAAEPVVLVALGDSLTAGYGLAPDEGLVPQLQGWLQAQGAEVVIQNAGVSGDTTAGGLARVDWALGPDAQGLIVTLGGNDMLRGLSPDEVQVNLDAILTAADARGLPVLLVAMKAPPNFGPEYKAEFDAIYPALAKEHGALLMPDFFQGFVDAGAVMTDPASYGKWMQADGIHPNAEGVKLVVASLGPHVLALIGEVE